MDCHDFKPLITPYLDGEMPATQREGVERHLAHCLSCRSDVAAEGVARDLVRTEREGLCAERAPAALRARCAEAVQHKASIRDRWLQLSMAATLVVGVGGLFLYQATARSETVLATELTLDHLKCFAVGVGAHLPQGAVADAETLLASSFDWRTHVVAQSDGVGLDLVNTRRCLYGEGKTAHLMYRYRGRPVSVFVLPQSVRPSCVVKVLGHEAVMWSSAGRTFVLIARSPREEAERMASVVRLAWR